MELFGTKRVREHTMYFWLVKLFRLGLWDFLLNNSPFFQTTIVLKPHFMTDLVSLKTLVSLQKYSMPEDTRYSPKGSVRKMEM